MAWCPAAGRKGDGDETCSCDCGAAAAAAFHFELGSPWPSLEDKWMRQKNRGIDFMPIAVGGTCRAGDDCMQPGEPFRDSTVDCSTMNLLNASIGDEPGDLWCEL